MPDAGFCKLCKLCVSYLETCIIVEPCRTAHQRFGQTGQFKIVTWIVHPNSRSYHWRFHFVSMHPNFIKGNSIINCKSIQGHLHIYTIHLSLTKLSKKHMGSCNVVESPRSQRHPQASRTVFSGTAQCTGEIAIMDVVCLGTTDAIP